MSPRARLRPSQQAVRLAVTTVMASVLAGACAPPDCAIDESAWIKSRPGKAPLVITSTHGGARTPKCASSGDPLARRDCTGLDERCASGPCRLFPDARVGRLVNSLARALTQCLGAPPAVVAIEADRAIVDVNRDLGDPGGAACAFADPRARPLWEAFHAATEAAISAAVMRAPGRALLLDVHTYKDLEGAPAPAVLLGAGDPFGTTLSHLRDDDPMLDLVFGPRGLREQLFTSVRERFEEPVDAALRIEPESERAALAELFNGRYVIHHYASASPAIDALQIEVSELLRDDPDLTADAIASALCGALGERLAADESTAAISPAASP